MQKAIGARDCYQIQQAVRLSMNSRNTHMHDRYDQPWRNQQKQETSAVACAQENTNSTQNGNGKYGPILFLQAYQTLSVLVDLVYAHCHGSLVAGLQTCGLLISVLHAFGPTYWLFQLEVRLFFFPDTHACRGSTNSLLWRQPGWWQLGSVLSWTGILNSPFSPVHFSLAYLDTSFSPHLILPIKIPQQVLLP